MASGYIKLVTWRLVITPEYRQTYDGRPFLKFGSADQNCRILIYATDMNLTFSKNSEHWFCDGTFKVTPDLFYQLYTIHALSENYVIPCVYYTQSML